MFSKLKSFLLKNQSQSQTIAKNTFWLFSGQMGGRVFRAILVIFAARILGPESWGAFSYAMSLVAFLLILSDIGISAIVTRESAKNPELGFQYFSTAFFLKILFLAIGALFIIFGAPLITKIPEARNLFPLIALLLIFDSLRNFGFAVSRALEKMQWEAINEILTNIFIVVLGFYFLEISPNSASLTIAYVIGTAVGFLLTVILLKHYFKNIFTHFNYHLIKPILSSSLPFALASFLGAIMINTDLLMLGWMRTPAEVGFYSAAQKPIQILYTLAALFAVSLFPSLTRSANEPIEKSKDLLEKSLSISLLAAMPIALGGIILSPELIIALFGTEYIPAIPAFQVLLLTLLIIFPSVIISNNLLAHGQQKKFVGFSALGAIGNVVFNFLLIPSLGILGCALATLITQIIADGFIWLKMKEVVDFSLFSKIKKIIIATALMGIVILFIKISGVNIFINIPLAIIIYLALLKIQNERLLNWS